MRQHGLTLLEMMVVLLIASMAVTLAFQSLGQWQRVRAAISAITGTNQQALLTEQWFETSLRGLLATDEQPFKGEKNQITGISMQPVQLHQGGSIGIEWSLENRRQGWFLQLKEQSQSPLQLPLPDVKEAFFLFLDKEGKPHEEWPPRLGLHNPLPEAIALKQIQEDGQERIWATAIAGARKPLFVPIEGSDFD